MCKSLLALAVIVWTLPVLAAKPVSVAALKQMLAEQEAAHKSDGTIAQELSELQLTEELTAQTLKRMTADVQAGQKTAQALELMADASALLAPPADELPPSARPDIAAQRAMYTAAVNYVVKTLRHLPDFLATRETLSFNDSPTVISHSGYAPVTAMHAVGTYRREITYRDGKEAVEAEAAVAKKEPGPTGLATWGEFGPVLAIILTDSLKGRVLWSRWEDGANGRMGVFHYEVPKAGSHYNVDFCCAWQELNSETQFGQSAMAYHGTPGYHGELYVDPGSGAILRVTLEAELGTTEVIRRAAISVEYGPVEIGGTRYICPTRSVAISQDMNRQGITIGGAMPLTRINETLFTGYHRFGSTSRILASVPNLPPVGVENASAPAETTATNAGQSATSPQPATAPVENAPPATAQSANPTAAVTEASAAAAPAENASPIPVEESHAEPAANGAPAEPSAQETPLFKTTTRDVVLDVVVTKDSGDAVTGLGKQDFAVSEDRRAQTVDFFEEHSANEATTSTVSEMPPMPAGAVTNVPPAAAGAAVNVLLLDSLNTPPQDQANVHRQILDFLKKMKPGTRIAIFTLGTKLRFVRGFTTDSSILLAALKQGEEGEKHGRSRNDAAEDASDLSKLQGMQASPYAIEALGNAQAYASVREYSARASMTFEALNYLAHYMAGVPGRKNLIWFASSFPVVIFPTVEQRASIEKNPSLPGYLQRVKQTADLFTVSQISVYPISAEGMMTEHFMEADSTGPDTSSPTGAPRFGSAPDGPMSNGTMSPFVGGASERSGIVNAMEQLASSTGGKAFYNTNDLNGAMEKAIGDGANYYTLGYSPTDKTMDGSFRRIDVSVTRGKYKLAYRHGYNAEETAIAKGQPGANPLAALLEDGLPGATGVLYGVAAKPGPTEEASPANRAGANTVLKGMVTRYRVDFTIRAGDVELKPNAQGGRSGRLLIGLKAFDRDGNALNWEGDDETLDLKDTEYGALVKNGIPAHLMIDVPAMVQGHLVTAVYDWNSGKAGTLEVPLGGGQQ
jgi:VWFA-related protein